MKLEEGQIVRKDGRVYVGYRLPNGKIVLALDPDSYQDIVDMPDPIVIGFGVGIFNYTTDTLWFTVEGSGGGWSWAGATQLGSIASGDNLMFRVGSIATRVKPASATTDDVTLMFTAYSDAYVTEIGTYPVIVSYHWIDSAAMTLLSLDDFETGTLEGWTQSGWTGIAIATDYALSHGKSAKAEKYVLNDSGTWTGSIRKTFAVPAATEAYLIANVKYVGYIKQTQTFPARVQAREMRISKAGSIIVRTGTSPYLLNQPSTVTDRQTNWLRMVAPIDVDETAQYRLETPYYLYSSTSNLPSSLQGKSSEPCPTTSLERSSR
ncbi:unnamed protein product [marine sediment metagenome]|uniref:Uncharacterized protein n=1 Tax=marine sediment metagenome TaxID=412755 RepID=X0Z6F0_9ZZZZ